MSGLNFMWIAALETYLMKKMLTCCILISPNICLFFSWLQIKSLSDFCVDPGKQSCMLRPHLTDTECKTILNKATQRTSVALPYQAGFVVMVILQISLLLWFRVSEHEVLLPDPVNLHYGCWSFLVYHIASTLQSRGYIWVFFIFGHIKWVCILMDEMMLKFWFLKIFSWLNRERSSLLSHPELAVCALSVSEQSFTKCNRVTTTGSQIYLEISLLPLYLCGYITGPGATC